MEKCFRFLILVSIFAVGVQSAMAQVPEFQSQFDSLVKKSGFRKEELGLQVIETGGQTKALFALNDSQKMVPASLSKIYTAAAVLENIPTSYQFVTQVLGTSPLDSKIQTLCLKGGGDPGFVSESMWFIVNELTRNNITEVTGEILIDSSWFDQERFDATRESVRVDRAYDAPVGAMSFNWNSVNIFVRPGKKAGDPAMIFADPESSYIQIVNDVKTVGGRGQDVVISRQTKANNSSDKDVFRISGKWGVNAGEKVYYRGITNPDQWAGQQLKAFLRQRGIKADGKVVAKKCPSGLSVLAEAKSKPLYHHVSDMMKWSNNYVAEMLIKNLGAIKSSAPGNMNKGVKIIGNLIDDLGLKNSKIVNPSGLTRDNIATASDINMVLNHVAKKFVYMPEFMAGLPVAGLDGTLKSRMAKNGVGSVRGKTGLLNGVVGLAGYAGRKDGRILSYAFIFNGSPTNEVKARALFDQLAESLVQ